MSALSQFFPTAFFRNQQEFTASGVFTVPAGVTMVQVLLVGGGASGSVQIAGTNSRGAAGGGGGQTVWRPVPVTPGNSIAVTIGAGGAGVTRSTVGHTGGNHGGNSTFGSLLTALAGSASSGFSLGGAGGGNYSRVDPYTSNRRPVTYVSQGNSSVNVYTGEHGISSPFGCSGGSGGISDVNRSYGVSDGGNSIGYGGAAYNGGGGGGGGSWGNGGDGNGASVAANSGGGSGGVVVFGGVGTSGNGGSGYCVVYW